jgi:ribosomal protein L16 Arg81 hydroxylase
MTISDTFSLQHWLGDVPLRTFAADYYQKLPYARTGGARDFAALASWESIERVLSAPGADAMVVRKGGRAEGDPPPTAAAAQALVAAGCTVLVRHAERHDEPLAELARGFARDFAAPVNIHVYITPGDSFGFGWHYDAEEVFVLQAAGRKEYSLRKNTVHPWPLEETLPADMHYERELMPLMRCLLAPDDWLYVPSGYWHTARGAGVETSISLAIGLMPPTAMDVLDVLRQNLPESILWRQRLPILGAASPLEEAQRRAAYRDILAMLADDFGHVLRSEKTLDRVLAALAAESTGCSAK